jgi:integrative and conjugative element protein (TIGR02256 family)
MQMQVGPTVWLSADALLQMQSEADLAFPRESGGVFMGYWSDDATAVITALIGPGPNARHEKRSFAPDQDWQLEEIARHYRETGRRETYLGDWHSHPNSASGDLSRTDRRVLRRVAKCPRARAPTPLMAILHGRDGTWQLAMWRATLRRTHWPWRTLAIQKCSCTVWG